MSERSERIGITARFAHGCTMHAAALNPSYDTMVHQ